LAQSVTQSHYPRKGLTGRECDVLRCMVDGLNNNEIADKQVVSIGTVKFHISNIFQKLGLDRRVESVKIAIEQKIV
jgi:DNA-binding NarL/FixJ family response regulator